MKKLLALLTIVICLSTPFSSHAEEPPVERTVWLVRVKVPQAVADYQTMRQMMFWCLYELEQDDPKEESCTMVNKLRAQIDENNPVLELKAALQVLKDEPQTKTVREHIKILEDGLQDIQDSIVLIP